MIQLLASRYRKQVAYVFIFIFYLSIVIPSSASGNGIVTGNAVRNYRSTGYSVSTEASGIRPGTEKNSASPVIKTEPAQKEKIITLDKVDIDGPSQPEMSSFKPAGTDNMVNLFTGDFSYNIPLLDVGGYPVNIFYDGNIGMEQEASWVGLGWNINPGNVNRNMRGVPDDFNGEDTLTQIQRMKPNKTWGFNVAGDLEIAGIKEMPDWLSVSVGASLGISYNNYLGPAVDFGIKGGAAVKLPAKVLSEKSADTSLQLKIGASVGANLSSRYGLTLSPSVSLTGSYFARNKSISNGLSLSTSYNSRNGIKALQITDQISFNRSQDVYKVYFDNDGSYMGYTKKSYSSTNSFRLSSSISFAKPSYIPTMRAVVTNEAWAGHFQVGGGIFGVYGSGEIEVYSQKAEITKYDTLQRKPMVGYLYYQNAVNNRAAVMDFTRFNDNEVTAKTPIISAPQYSYDVFSIQGEGTGGSIRAYRNDMGYVRDNFTGSKDKSLSIGGDIGIPGHYGANVNIVKTPSTIGEWTNGNKLRNVTGFSSAAGDKENVYLRSPGESSVLNPNQFDSIGGTDMVRFKLGGTGTFPTIEPVLERFTSSGSFIGETSIQKSTGTTDRKKRTQVVSFLTAEEASKAGLDTMIKSYDATTFLDANYKLKYDSISRVSEYRKKHHISQVNVTEADGKRYVYGIPVYNVVQKDLSFTVAASTETSKDLVTFSQQEATANSPQVQDGASKDGFVQITQTPAFAHSYLLSGLLSPDYVDVNGDGITEDDLGGAVKFNYTRIKQGGQWANHKWRTPLSSGFLANFNQGNRSETKDDKGIVSYGERESWYLQSIESKTMIAFFTLEDRTDGKGATTEYNGVNAADNSSKRLKKIDLYSKADLKKNGLVYAKPIKTVNFGYSYTLCQGTPDNLSGSGKLTLDSIWFTYNGQARANKNKYAFSYGASTGDNPVYAFSSADRWGTYKPDTANPSGMRNSLYPYSLQDKSNHPIDQNASAWALKKVLLPSGGQIEVTYESDDYAYVQNKRASAMMEIAGFGNTSGAIMSTLYQNQGGGAITENDYVFIKVPSPCSTPADVYNKYLKGQSQLAFKLAVMMPKGIEEYIPSYATVADYGVYNSSIIWVRLNKVNNEIGPLSLTAIEYLREQLPGQAFKGADMSGGSLLDAFGVLLDMFVNLGSQLKDPVTVLRQGTLTEVPKAKTALVNKSFVRLNDPDGFKYGGGSRVKSVVLKDNWKEMNQNQLYTSVYGQEYDYTTKEVFNGVERIISSGVASYEPSIGGEENPFQTIVQVANKLPLGPTSYGAIEMPVLDAFFPSPVVGYSKVTVRSIKKNPDPSKKSRSGIGKQVTEFYTAKDFPVYYNHTSIDPGSDKQDHRSSLLAFFYKYAFDSRALSQGFIVATNDMHGKIKSQSSYPENDSMTRINFTQNFYRNTGANGLNEKFDFAHQSLGGEVKQGNMGIDIELMTDTREFSVKGSSLEVQAQVDLFPVLLPIWLPFIWPVAGNSENTYRAVTTTKLISYHGVLDSVVVIDKGSQVSTKNLVYDAETGSVIVNRTNNEFDKPIYSVSYPAYWAYSGMGLAYKNIDAVYSNVSFNDGRIVSGNVPAGIFESGDELFIMDVGSSAGCDPATVSSPADRIVWVLDLNKNTGSLTNTNPDYVFIDKKGKLYSRTGVKFRIIRSGKRNVVGAPVASVTLMTNPVDPVTHKLVYTTNSKVINASAVEYKEKWQTDNDVFYKYALTTPSGGTNLVTNGDFSLGNTGFTSGYTYYPTQHQGGNEGKYHVINNPHNWNLDFTTCPDHTSGTGNMMVVNGSLTQHTTVWQQTITVEPNTNYVFRLWASTVYPSNPAYLQMNVNSEMIGQNLQLTSTTCTWYQFIRTWNSGSNTSATLTLKTLSTTSTGNDFAIDDVFFGKDDCTGLVEVVNCTGYLEKNINPYRKGLLGTFRGYRNMVFYGDRAETNPTAATNLPQNGFLSGFFTYWNFNASNNLVPDVASTKWVWNTQATRYNSKGLELETKDALGIYTSAQYGFNKTTPVAIASNSRNFEMFYEGFEDVTYDETLNAAASNLCAKKHTDWSGLSNSQFAETQVTGISAHSGSKMLQVNSNASTSINFPIGEYDDGSYSITTGGSANVESLTGAYGGNITYSSPSAATIFWPSGTTSSSSITGGLFWNLLPYRTTQSSSVYYSYYTNTEQYFEIKRTGTYIFSALSTNAWVQNVYPNTPMSHPDISSIYITDINGTGFPYEVVGNSVSSSGKQKLIKMCLPKGVYKLYLTFFASYSYTCGNPGYPSCNYGGSGQQFFPEDRFNFTEARWPVSLSDAVIFYKNYSPFTTCTYTKPIAATTTMQNPTFSVPVNKKMVFSAWVKDNCSANGSCSNSNQANISFNNGGAQNVTISPSGPVIEGWQRYEGYFTAPADATQMTLRLDNNTGQPIYFDDIRIHPFNSNMKSYVYDPVNLRLKAELDANNYASYYEYDEEGTLIRTKIETKEGVKTVTESRSAKQKNIRNIQ